MGSPTLSVCLSGHYWSHLCHLVKVSSVQSTPSTVHCALVKMKHSWTMLLNLVICIMLMVTQARRSPPSEDYDDGYSSNSIRKPNMDVGQFPFKRGERPIFNFDQGDEVGQLYFFLILILFRSGFYRNNTGAD